MKLVIFLILLVNSIAHAECPGGQCAVGQQPSCPGGQCNAGSCGSSCPNGQCGNNGQCQMATPSNKADFILDHLPLNAVVSFDGKVVQHTVLAKKRDFVSPVIEADKVMFWNLEVDGKKAEIRLHPGEKKILFFEELK